MKLLVLSDIHGSLAGLRRGLAQYEAEQAGGLLLLGDLLYHGPRNPLPEDYNPKEVAAELNRWKDRAMTVRGNCDAEVDQMLIEFPIMAEYAMLYLDGRRCFATHGHHHHMENLPQLAAGDVFLQGHTHVPVARLERGIALCNPGSVSLPKEGHPPTYGVLDAEGFRVKDFEGKVRMEVRFE